MSTVTYICHPSYNGKYNIGGLWSRLAWAKKTLSKMTTAKRTGGVAREVEYLLSKLKAPSSNPSTTKIIIIIITIR
jgi:hypothetical protein